MHPNTKPTVFVLILCMVILGILLLPLPFTAYKALKFFLSLGLLYAAVLLGVAGLVGVLPMTASLDDVTLADHRLAWWIPVIALGLITAAFAYATGIAAVRRLEPRLASFVALTELLAAIVAAWLMLDQVPDRIQLVGGALVLAGVIVVKLGERPTPETEIPVPG